MRIINLLVIAAEYRVPCAVFVDDGACFFGDGMRGSTMLLRLACAVAILLIFVAGRAHHALAQYSPKPPLPYPAIAPLSSPGTAYQSDRREHWNGQHRVSLLTGSNAKQSGAAPDDSSAGTLVSDESTQADEPKELPPQFRREVVDYPHKVSIGTIIVDTANTYLYFVLGGGKAIRYGIGVGREGFTWSGSEKVTKMAEWPDWHPPPEMIERQPYLPRFMAGGEGNPLGARALYLGNTIYRIHGTNQPSTIGTFASSGCIRLTNKDVIDLYGRVKVGTRVVVLPGAPPTFAAVSSGPAVPGRAVEHSLHSLVR